MPRARSFALLAVAAALATSVHAQTATPAADDRAADVAAIRAHVDGIFRAYIAKDRDTVRATHSADWRGFLTGSRGVIRGIDEYMQAADGVLKYPTGGMTGYTITEFDVTFHGDVAVICYVADVEAKWDGVATTDKLRVVDVYEKRGGEWIQVASNTARHPEAIARQTSEARPVPPPVREALLSAREKVWRAWFAGDRAALEAMIPDEAIAIGDGDGAWEGRAQILADSERFAKSGAKLVRLEFPRTDVQVYGSTFVLYTTYVFEVESGGKRETTSGRGTEVFVYRDGAFVNTGWHLDAQPRR
jgi:hypothetical protein